jgi:hypothetical protein
MKEIGLCNQVYLNGVPELSIMRQSRHQSLDTVRKYIRDKSLPRQSRTQTGIVPFAFSGYPTRGGVPGNVLRRSRWNRKLLQS